MKARIKLVAIFAVLCIALFLSSTAGCAKLSLPSLIGDKSTAARPGITPNASSKEITQPFAFDAIVVLPTKDLAKTKEAVKFIRENGGVVSIVYMPNTIVALKLSKNLENQVTLRFKAKVFRDTTKLAELKKLSKIGASLLSAKASGIKYVPSAEPFKDTVLIPPDMPAKPIKQPFPLRPPGSTGYPPPASSTYTSYYMVGDVFASVVLMESNGTIDSNLENWTSAEENTVDAQIANGFNWLVNRSLEYNLSYPLTFWTYPSHFKAQTGYEPTQRPFSDRGLWIQEALDQLGVPPNANTVARARDYDNILRAGNSADWAFTIFVADNSDYPNSLWGPWAYFGGPYEVVKHPADIASTSAHETLHIFWALDEYMGGSGCTSGSSCTQKAGLLQVENQNCQYSCAISQNCIMRGWGIVGASLCYYTAGQIGWRDLNANAVTDSIDYSYNSADLDTDGDGIIDYWDLDDDNDGISDVSDACPKSYGYALYSGCSPPAVTVDANATAIQLGDTIRISANATDNFKIMNLEIYVDSISQTGLTCSGIGTANANCYKDLSYSVAGSHTFHATAKDDNNETRDPAIGEKTFDVLPDSTNPTISITGPTGQVDVGQTITINATASDNFQISWIAIYIDGIVVQNCTISAKSGSCSNSTSYSATGSHTYHAETSDSSSNPARDPASGEKSFDVVDATKPAISSIVNVAALTATISADVTDNVQVSTVKFYLDSAEVSPTCSGIGTKTAHCDFTKSFANSGSHTYHIEANDSSNNMGRDPPTGEKSFTVTDDTKPKVVINSVGNPVVGQIVTFKADASDDIQISEIKIYIDGAEKKSCSINKQSGTCSLDAFFPSVGQHSYYALATDSSGNSNQTSAYTATASADTAAPWLGASYSPWPARAGQKITISAGADDNAQVKTIRIYLGSDTPTKTCTIQAKKGYCSLEWTPSAPEFFYYYADAFDYSGNSIKTIPGGGTINP